MNEENRLAAIETNVTTAEPGRSRKKRRNQSSWKRNKAKRMRLVFDPGLRTLGTLYTHLDVC